ERDARPGGGRERSRAGPRGAEHHAGGGQLVFGLDQAVLALLGLRVDAVALTEFFERLHERRRRRDRVPGADGRPGEHRAPPGRTAATSFLYVSGFSATTRSMSCGRDV